MAMDALITGASTGIGRAAVKVLAGHGWRAFAGVRKVADAESLRGEFGDKVRPLVFDVTDAAAVAAGGRAKCASTLGGRTLKGLVNNAGMGLGGPLALQPVDEIRRVFEVNVLGAVTVSQAFIPLLGGDRSLDRRPRPHRQHHLGRRHARGAVHRRLRDVETRAGSLHRLPAPRTDALWHRRDRDRPRRRRDADLGQGAKASTRPATPTPISRPALSKFLQGFVAGGRNGLPPERIGEAIHLALTARQAAARYALLRNPFFNWTVPRLLPKRVSTAGSAALGLTPPLSGAPQESPLCPFPASARRLSRSSRRSPFTRPRNGSRPTARSTRATSRRRSAIWSRISPRASPS